MLRIESISLGVFDTTEPWSFTVEPAALSANSVENMTDLLSARVLMMDANVKSSPDICSSQDFEQAVDVVSIVIKMRGYPDRVCADADKDFGVLE